MAGFRAILERIEDTLTGRNKVRTVDIMTKGREAAEKARNFHAVTIRPSRTGCVCGAARDLEGKRFLSAAAPALPLPDCDAMECGCIYTHFRDRRHQRRRNDDKDMAGAGPAYEGLEHRDGKGRRNVDNKEIELSIEVEDERPTFVDAEDYFNR